MMSTLFLNTKTFLNIAGLMSSLNYIARSNMKPQELKILYIAP